jgi:hypothetical protein
MAKTSPTQRSLALLRQEGYRAEVVERWNPHARVRQDLFTIIDIVAIGNGHTVGVQTTTKSNMKARHDKIVECEAYPDLVRAGWKIIVHGWYRDKDKRWTVKTLEL